MSGSYKRINRAEIKLKKTPLCLLDATLSDGQRTNNVCEGWNNASSDLLARTILLYGCSWSVLQKDVREVWTTLAIIDRIDPLVKRLRKVAQDLQMKLKKMCLEYLNGEKDIKTFINNVGHTIRF